MYAAVPASVRLALCAVLVAGSLASGCNPADVVTCGETIQDAVDLAPPNTVITIKACAEAYNEEVVIEKDGITLRGEADGDSLPVIDGGGSMDNGVFVTGVDDNDRLTGFTMERIEIRGYVLNGVLAQYVDDVTLRDLVTDDTGEYGLFPIFASNVLVENNVTTNNCDASIYVGESTDIVVRNNEVYDNVAGIEIENSINAEVYDNDAHDNTAGILVFQLPGAISATSEGHNIHDNLIINNNRPNDGCTPVVALVPYGSGLVVMATDDSTFANNDITGNDSFGIGLVGLYTLFDPATTIPNGDPNSDNNTFLNNNFGGNATNPDPFVVMNAAPADLIFDSMGSGNCWSGHTTTDASVSSFPPLIEAAFPCP